MADAMMQVRMDSGCRRGRYYPVRRDWQVL